MNGNAVADQFGNYEQKEKIKGAYVSFIQNQRWDFFTTITFRRPRRDSIYACGVLWKALHNPPGHIRRAFLVSEPHSTGYLHYHGLLFEQRSSLDEGILNQRDYQFMLRDKFGFSQVSPIRSMAEVAGYCTKYILKGMADPVTDYHFLGDWTKDYGIYLDSGDII